MFISSLFTDTEIALDTSGTHADLTEIKGIALRFGRSFRDVLGLYKTCDGFSTRQR